MSRVLSDSITSLIARSALFDRLDRLDRQSGIESVVQSLSLCASVPNTSDDHLDDYLGDNFTWHPLVIICINNIFVLTFEWLGDSRSASSSLLQRGTREVLEIQRL